MSELLLHSLGRDLKVPAGTLVILLDFAFVRRPGPGGYCAIIMRGKGKDLIMLRGGMPEATTRRLLNEALANLADEIRENKALFILRDQAIASLISDRLSRFPMLRVLGSQPMAVCEATRHAAIMAERCEHTKLPSTERDVIAPGSPEPDGFDDIAPIAQAVSTLADNVQPYTLDNPQVVAKSQAVLEAANLARLATLGDKVNEIVKHDIPQDSEPD